MTIKITNHQLEEIAFQLQNIVEIPNKNILEIRASYDPNLNVISISYLDYKTEKWILVIDKEL